MAEGTHSNQNIQANENSTAVGSLSVGGSIEGSFIIGSHHVVGFTSDQVSAPAGRCAGFPTYTSKWPPEVSFTQPAIP